MMDEPAPKLRTQIQQLVDTQRAFDSVAPVYDGPTGNNALIQRMREQLWEVVENRISRPAKLLDVGCGTGIDAVHFAARGHDVLAVDWSMEMVSQTRKRVRNESPKGAVNVRQLGIHELDSLSDGGFHAIYSNLGVLNCAEDLDSFAVQCARLLRPDGLLAVSVIGRFCPWELVYYLLRGRPARAAVRFRSSAVPVPLNDHTVWTRYYTPGEFQKPFTEGFERTHLRTMNLLLPPPYLIRWFHMCSSFWNKVGRVERAAADLPGIRSMGDHFLIVLRRNR